MPKKIKQLPVKPVTASPTKKAVAGLTVPAIGKLAMPPGTAGLVPNPLLPPRGRKKKGGM